MTDEPGIRPGAQEGVTAFAPATIGNVTCGLDVFGLAIAGLGDRVRATPRHDPGVEIGSITVADDSPFPVAVERIPTDPTRNSAGIAVDSLLGAHTPTSEHAPAGERSSVDGHSPGQGIRLDIEKGLPLSAGLGGSAASAVAGVVAVDALLGLGLPPEELLRHAARGEWEGSGSEAGDNLAPALLGGWLLVRSTDPFDLVRLPVPEGLRVVVAHPSAEVRTADARAILGREIPLRSAVQQWANTAAVVAALHTGDLDLLERALNDVVAEPARAHLVPGFAQVKVAALEAGAIGCSLSGSGPSVFALCAGEEVARRSGAEMVAAFEEAGAGPVTLIVSTVAEEGAVVERHHP